MAYQHKTKIVCTIGPSTWEPEVMRKLIEAGMNVARVNGAFADPTELDKVANLVRAVSDKVALMVDVKGPEVRMNKFAEALPIKPGDQITIGNTEADQIYPANYKDLYTHLQTGQRILVGDGDVEMVVKSIEGDKMHCEVVYGELLKPGKALNLPGANIVTDVLTEKDKENLEHSIKTGWDFVSASFVTSAAAAQQIKDFIGDRPMKLIAKIEDQAGVDNIDEILEVVDGVMIARGGLGIELGLEQVPLVQRTLIAKCNAVGKPVITATQMLESMIDNPRPTRGEVSDVATAILLGSDAVMLSAESSAGKYPVEAVKMITSIARTVEPHITPKIIRDKAHASNTADAITRAAAEMCASMSGEIKSVLVVSQSGTTARLLGRHSVTQPIYAFTSTPYFLRTLLLSKGINDAFIFPGMDIHSEDYTRDKAIRLIVDQALREGVVSKGEKVLFVGKTPTTTDDTIYFPNLFEIITV